MKRNAVFAVIFLVLAAGSLLQAGEIIGPKIYAKELHVDFGRVREGSSQSHVFEIMNMGSEPLIIQRVVSS